jgi:signal transduction histidine kinase
LRAAAGGPAHAAGAHPAGEAGRHGPRSAGIAHEIRNPLAAISQANALLLEDELPPASSAWRAWWPTTWSA